MCLSLCSLLEIYLRLSYRRQYINPPWYTDNPFKIDSELIHSFRPYSNAVWKSTEFIHDVHINNLGFRNTEDTNLVKPNNIYRIITVGDSFTFGHGVKDTQTYPYLLAKIMNSKSYLNIKIEVINAGVPDYSPDQEYRQIVTRLVQLKPDLIIWNLTFYDIGEIVDYNANYPSLYGLKNNLELIPLDARFNSRYIRNYLFVYLPKFIKNTYLFDFIANKLFNIKFFSKKQNLSHDDMTNWAKYKLLSEIRSVYNLSKNSFKLIIIRLPTQNDIKQQYDNNHYGKIFADIEAELKKNNILFFNLADKLKMESSDASINSPNQMLGITNVNLNKLFYTSDGHPNKFGTKVFAEEVGNYLIDKLNL